MTCVMIRLINIIHKIQYYIKILISSILTDKRLGGKSVDNTILSTFISSELHLKI